MEMEEKEYPKRKNHRLKYYDYSRNGAYFITMCTYDRQKLFGEIKFDENGKVISSEETEKYPTGHTVGADSISARMVTEVYYELINKYDGYGSLGFVVMPDHVHFVVSITRADMESAPTEIPKFVQEFKRYTTIKYIGLVKQNILPPFHLHVWQRDYIDRVIRSRDELYEVRKYIKQNPVRVMYE